MSDPNLPREARRGAPRPRSITLWVLALSLVAAACTEEVTGPEPAVEDPARGQDPLPVAPGIVCRDQMTTPVMITGEGFSPVPIDIPNDPRTALPTVRLTRTQGLGGEAGEPFEFIYSGDPDTPTNLSLLSWQSQSQMTFMVPPPCASDADCGGESVCHPTAGVCTTSAEDAATGPLEEGIYDVLVTNPNTNAATSVGSLAVIEKPTVGALTPALTCLAQGPREVTLSGTRFLTIEDAEATVEINNVTAPFTIDDGGFEGCTDIPHAGYGVARFCSTGTMTLAQDSVPVGYPEVRVHNPETAACVSEEAINLRVVPPPTITAATEVAEDASAVTEGDGTVVCVTEGPRQVVLHGQDFLSIDGATPTVTLDDTAVTTVGMGGCEPLEVMGLTVERCTQVTIEVPEAMAATDAPYQPVIEMTNPEPAGCNDNTSGGREGLLTIAPPPDIVEVVPPLVCVDDGDREVSVNGDHFLMIDGAVPEVVVGATTIDPASVVAQGCTDVGVGNRDVQRCASLTVTLPQGQTDLGQPPVTVTNPQPAGCSDTEEGVLTVVAGPEITSATPPLVCTDDADRSILIEGTGFLTVDGATPTVTMDGQAASVVAATGCTPVTVNGLTVEDCTTLEVSVAQGTLSEGDAVVEVTNPAPADCTVSDSVVLTVPPQVMLVSVDPGAVCVSNTGVVSLTIRGQGFLTIDGAAPSLMINGQPVNPDGIDGCTALDVDGLTVESCDTITATFDTTGLPVGAIPIEVTNRDPSGCGVSDATLFQIAPPPTISAIQPAEICSDDPGEAFSLMGTGFVPGTAVRVADSAGAETVGMVSFVSDAQLDVRFTSGLPAGLYDVTVDNGAGCESTSTGGLTVHPAPLVFFVDPPIVFSGISTEVTVFVSGLDQLAGSVELIDSAGAVTAITDYSSPDRPGRILATIPEGLAADTYEVSVTSVHACTSSLNGQLRVTDALDLDLVSVDPSFASPTRDTAATISSNDPPDAGLVNFSPVPRAYLNPVAGGAATATAMEAVIQEDPATLSAIVPGGMTPGAYDLIVVNPTGEVGLLAGAVTVTVEEPPRVTSVAPATFDANTAGQTATIFGENFGADPAQMSVVLECQDFASGAPAANSGAVTIDTAAADQLGVTIDASGVNAGCVCEVIVTNPDGSVFRFSAISVKEPAQNLNPWVASPAMQEARRAPGVVAGRPTDRSRFLYAIGGDEGTLATARVSVESTPVGVFGGMGTWSFQRNDLSSVMDTDTQTPFAAPRAFAEAVQVGGFIYLTGGHDGTSSTSTVLRAQILDPQAAPEITDVDAALGDATTGLGEGLWYYRVTAVFPDTDPSNPGGESLPGEVLPVQLPSVADQIVLTLSWEAVPGASGYRVYRTPVVDDLVTTMQLIGETVGNGSTTLTDDGLVADAAVTPLPQGSTGVWHTVAPLMSARSAHATVALASATPGVWYLYAVGGRDAAGSVLASGEYATLTLNADGSQALSPWQPLTASLSAARAELGGFVIADIETSVLSSGETYVYFGQGRTDTNLSSTFEAGLVGADGDILAYAPVGGPTPSRVGATDLSANGWLFVLGGANGNPSNGNDASAEMITPPPLLSNWDALGGGSMIEPRIHTGSTKESAFFFIVGGANSGGALATVERTIQ